MMETLNCVLLVTHGIFMGFHAEPICMQEFDRQTFSGGEAIFLGMPASSFRLQPFQMQVAV